MSFTNCDSLPGTNRRQLMLSSRWMETRQYFTIPLTHDQTDFHNDS